LGLKVGTYVEVEDRSSRPWYGQVVESVKDEYRVRFGGSDRVVTVPEHQVDRHPVTRRFHLQQDLGRLKGGAKVREIVEGWAAKKKSHHDVFQTLEVILRARLLADDPNIKKVLELQADEALPLLKRAVKELENLLGRQLVQSWESVTPENVVTRLSWAWDIFVAGVSSLKDSPESLDIYFSNCLAHDKGYAQTLDSTQTYQNLKQPQESEKLGFSEVLSKALRLSSNTNIWGGGQQGGIIAAQLQNPPIKTDETIMWAMLMTPLLDAHNSAKKDWDYIAVIKSNLGELFETVRKFVPQKVKLHKETLEKAYSDL